MTNVGWIVSTLGEVASKITDGSHNPPQKQQQGVPMLSARNIENGRINYNEFRLISEDDFHIENARTDVEPNDVLLTIVGTIGKSTVVPNEEHSFALQRSVAVIKPLALLPKFLMYQLQAPHAQHFLQSNARGTAQKGVYLKTLSTLPVVVPPLAEQRRIVAEIETQFTRLDAAEAALERSRLNLVRLRDSINRAVVDGRLSEDTKPETWPLKKLVELGELGRGKSKHRPRNDPKLYGGSYPFIQTGDVGQTDGYIRDYRQTYSELGVAQSKLWPEGTLCITIAANIADTGILTFPACFPDSVVGFVAADGPHVARYVDFFFRANKDELERFAPATAQKNINLAILQELLIPLAPADELFELVNRAERLLEWIASSEAATELGLARAQRLRQSILQRAFSGQLVPQDPNDEPASVMLERIANACASAAPPRRKAKDRRPRATSPEVQRGLV